jgi:hypothetical protein
VTSPARISEGQGDSSRGSAWHAFAAAVCITSWLRWENTSRAGQTQAMLNLKTGQSDGDLMWIDG